MSMSIPIGNYRTEAGSTVEISGEHGGIASCDLGWVEESNCCYDCTVDPYPTDEGGGVYRLTWSCEECGGGSAVLKPCEVSA